MGCGMPGGGPVAGGAWLGLRFPIPWRVSNAGVVPAWNRAKPILVASRILREAVKLAVRVWVVSLATPAAAAEDRSAGADLLTSGPEPANLVGFGLALAVLFFFRRFSKTH